MGDAKGKVFSVERRAQERGHPIQSPTAVKDVMASFSSNAFEEALLRKAVGLGIPAAAQPAAQPAEETDPSDPALGSTDIDHELRVEIAQMVRSIGRAKTQIAAIKHPMSAEDQMQTASLQLDTIVQTTETATNEIMESVDPETDPWLHSR